MKRGRVILTILLIIPLVGAVAVYTWIHHVADRKWAQAEERIRELVRRHPTGDSRQVLSKVTEASKDNQIHFVAAIREAARKRLRHHEASTLVRTRQDPIDLLDDAQEWLDRLHQGARRCAARPADFPPRWQGDWDYVTLTYMMNCSVLRARQQRQNQSPVDAAETLLDSLQLSRFWAASGKGYNRIYALDNAAAGIEELRDILTRETLSSENLLRIDRELQPIDDALQSPLRDLEPALARWAEGLGATDPKTLSAWEWAPYRWKYLLPERLMKAEAFEYSHRHLEQFLALEGRSYLEVSQYCRRLDVEAIQSKNPIIQRHTVFSYELGWVELERKAEIRLLRAAARYPATGELIPIDDPFGGKLLFALAEADIKFWSLGNDGMDDGGTIPRDLVIQVERRPE